MSLAAKAWALLGAANFVATTVNDEPWWPNVLLVCVVAISLIIQILIVKLRSPMFNRLAKAGLLKAK